MLTRTLFSGLLMAFIFAHTVGAFQPTTRVFPFSYATSERVVKDHKKRTGATLFMTSADTGYNAGGSVGSLAGIWGQYDLKDIITSNNLFVTESTGSSYEDPISRDQLFSGWADKSMVFDVDTVLRSHGARFGYHGAWAPEFLRFSKDEQLASALKRTIVGGQIVFGFDVPIMHVSALNRYTFDRAKSDSLFSSAATTLSEADLSRIEEFRGEVHQDVGLAGNTWAETGAGDLDIYVGMRRTLERQFYMRSIDFTWLFGAICPTGKDADPNYPSSISFGSKTAALYSDILLNLELKPCWHAGLTAGLMLKRRCTDEQRVPVYKELAQFSPLKLNLEHRYGLTFKCAPYLTIENIADGLDVTVSYLYARHGKDAWTDPRVGPTVSSYMTRRADGTTVTSDKLSEVTDRRSEASEWDTRHLSAALTYDARQAMGLWGLKPTLSVRYDHPLGGRGAAKNKCLSLSATVNF
jgi:hypothetical protein